MLTGNLENIILQFGPFTLGRNQCHKCKYDQSTLREGREVQTVI